MEAGATPPTVHLVDDDELTRKAMTRLVNAAGLETRSYGSAREFLDASGPGMAGCIVLDVQLPDLNGLDLQVALAERGIPIPIVFLTGHGEIPDSVRAIQRGAVDFLTKPVDGEILLAAISRALVRDAAARAERSREEALRERFDRLTPREQQVFRHLISGQLNKQVAADLEITERTIKMHRASILQKLEVASMAEVARLAADLGIDPTTPPPDPRT